MSLPASLWREQTGLLSLRAQGLSHPAPSPSLGPLLTTSPSQRRAGAQSRRENLPTVAVMPGENRSSQNLLRKDVFPTAEFPTNTILKSWSGVEGEPSSCGRWTLWPAAGTVDSPCSRHRLPDPCLHGVRGESGDLASHQHWEATRPGMRVALGSGHQQEGRLKNIQPIFVVCLECCRPCAGPEDAGRRPGLWWSEGGRHGNKQSQHNVPSMCSGSREEEPRIHRADTLSWGLKQRQRFSSG